MIVAIMSAAVAACDPALAVEPRLVCESRAFLDAYAANDSSGVRARIAPETVVYGSDLKEVVRGPDGVTALMVEDFRLWRTARIGAMRDIHVVTGQDLGVVSFHAPFSAGGGPEVPVRFTLTWRRVGSAWRLAQSSNTVPTVGSSAAELNARR